MHFLTETLLITSVWAGRAKLLYTKYADKSKVCFLWDHSKELNIFLQLNLRIQIKCVWSVWCVLKQTVLQEWTGHPLSLLLINACRSQSVTLTFVFQRGIQSVCIFMGPWLYKCVRNRAGPDATHMHTLICSPIGEPLPWAVIYAVGFGTGMQREWLHNSRKAMTPSPLSLRPSLKDPRLIMSWWGHRRTPDQSLFYTSHH